MHVTITPDADVVAFSTVKATFSGTISNGHCAGDSFSFGIPAALRVQDGAVYLLKSPDGSTVATMNVTGQTVRVTFSTYVQTHEQVAVTGFLSAQINDSAAPGATQQLSWTFGGTTVTTPVTMASCPNCSIMPTDLRKHGDYTGHALLAVVNLPTSTASNESFSFSDTLTSPGQAMACSEAVTTDGFTQLNAWGNPTDVQTGPTPVITSCTASKLTGTVVVPAVGTVVRAYIPISVTDASRSSWTDTADATAAGTSWSAPATISELDGGGEGVGVVPTSTAIATPSPAAPSPAEQSPSAETASGSGLANTGSRTTGLLVLAACLLLLGGAAVAGSSRRRQGGR
ncbi:Ig-like domain-containing protein [Jatrophihabitans sp. GAS493]|uniref:Ig-like domain-containing protein n=1 Tax=Jatrophihabitans sp. GAS493 TaxID=1907575 RepID=UPI000BB8BB87|nr:Ig-like domain-containing protein [Jatrophihabitans sp. GAS493]